MQQTTSLFLTVPVFLLDSYFTKKRKDSLPTPLVCRLARYLGPNGCRNDTCTGLEKEVTTPERDICMFWPCRRNCLVHVFWIFSSGVLVLSFEIPGYLQDGQVISAMFFMVLDIDALKVSAMSCTQCSSLYCDVFDC